MKLRFPLPPPKREDGSLFPAAVAAGLLLLAMLQLMMTSDVDLPRSASPAMGGATRSRPPVVKPVPIPMQIAERPLFAPRGAGDGAAQGASPGSRLGGALLAGTVQVRGRRYAVLTRGDGRAINLPVGGRVAGWRLVGLGEDRARFIRDGERIEVPYGAAPAPVAEPQEGQGGEE